MTFQEEPNFQDGNESHGFRAKKREGQFKKAQKTAMHVRNAFYLGVGSGSSTLY